MEDNKLDKFNKASQNAMMGIVNSAYVIAMFLTIVSAIVLIPCFSKGTDGSIGFQMYKDTWELVLRIIFAVLTALVSVMLFLCFLGEGKLVASRTEVYKECYNKELALFDKGVEKKKPINPHVWEVKQKILKGFTVLVSSMTAVFFVADCVISYRASKLIAIALSIILSVCFGLMQMVKTYTMYTDGYKEWIDWEEVEINKLKELNNSNE